MVSKPAPGPTLLGECPSELEQKQPGLPDSASDSQALEWVPWWHPAGLCLLEKRESSNLLVQAPLSLWAGMLSFYIVS